MSEADDIKEKIKSRGYWEVDIRPEEESRNRFDSISDCLDKVRECVVLIRGWDYPHFGRNPSPYPRIRRIESYVDFGSNKEFWTMFLNGHFYHIFSCREDWLAEDVSVFGKSKYSDTKPNSVLGYIMTLYSATEIFEFAIRLSQKGIFGNKARIQITLHGMNNRILTSFARVRHPIWGENRCREDTIPWSVSLSINDLISQGHENAVDFTLSVYELFGMFKVNRQMIVEMQKRFLERKF